MPTRQERADKILNDAVAQRDAIPDHPVFRSERDRAQRVVDKAQAAADNTADNFDGGTRATHTK